MVIEVYSQSTPAYRRRALGCSFLLLVLTAWLAVDMSSTRAGDPLGPRVEPPGWRISFRVPRHFLRGDSTYRSVIPYFGPHLSPQPRGARPVLALWEVNARDAEDPAAICDSILLEYGIQAADAGRTPRATTEPRPMGNRAGMEAGDPDGQALVRAVRLEDGVGYAVSLIVTDGAIDKSLYHLYDLTCESIEYSAP